MRLKSLLIVLLAFVNLFLSFSESPGIVVNQNKCALKILSWNVYLLPFLSSFNNGIHRARRIGSELVKSDYQIIVFQEAFNQRCRKILWDSLSKSFPYEYGPVNSTKLPFKTNSGLWVVSKIPLKNLGEIRFKCSKGFDVIARKGGVLFQGCFQGNQFQLLATHLQADKQQEIRKKQCKQLRKELLNKYFQQDIPQFICGDFNIDIDDTESYREMLSVLDAQNGKLSGSLQTTYDEINNNLAKLPKGKPRILDYVLVRNEELVGQTNRKVIPFKTEINGRSTFLSDHYGVEFSVNFGLTINTPDAPQLAFGK